MDGSRFEHASFLELKMKLRTLRKPKVVLYLMHSISKKPLRVETEYFMDLLCCRSVFFLGG